LYLSLFQIIASKKIPSGVWGINWHLNNSHYLNALIKKNDRDRQQLSNREIGKKVFSQYLEPVRHWNSKFKELWKV